MSQAVSRPSRHQGALAWPLLLCLAAADAGAATDWPQFDFDARHSGVNPAETVLTPANVGTLHLLWKVSLPEVADGAPAYLSRVPTPAGPRDLLFVTTTRGHLVALDAATGATVWVRQPATGPRYTTSSPAVDPGRQFVYSYGLDGAVHKYRVGDGGEVTGGGWPQLASRKPKVEKGSSALAVATTAEGTSYLYVANGGYPVGGDLGDYQGHVTAIDLATGVQQVFNTECSDQPVHFVAGGTPDCASVRGAVWARAGVVYDAETGKLFLATGNGAYDADRGGRDWGDSVLALNPDATGAGGGLPLDSYTPTDFQALDDQDLDLGSTAPAILPAPPGSNVPHLALQGGKDALLRLLDLDDLSGRGGPGHLAGELQTMPVPQGGEVLTAPAVWVDPAGAGAWAFVANDSGISGLQLTLQGGGDPLLVPRWTRAGGGTSPVLANGILFYDSDAGMQALDPATGRQLWHDGTPNGRHWESPIVVDGHVYVTDEGGGLIAYGLGSPPPCAPDATTLCLNGQRMQVRAGWTLPDGTAGAGQAVALTPGTGTFWFFDPADVELIVKVLDGCASNHSFWVFAAGLTDLETVLTVIDTRTGASKTYRNPRGTAFLPVQDTSALSCP